MNKNGNDKRYSLHQRSLEFIIFLYDFLDLAFDFNIELLSHKDVVIKGNSLESLVNRKLLDRISNFLFVFYVLFIERILLIIIVKTSHDEQCRKEGV